MQNCALLFSYKQKKRELVFGFVNNCKQTQKTKLKTQNKIKY